MSDEASEIKNTEMRVGVIGDVHGHEKELYELLGTLEAYGVDRIILLGDLVDRGPRSRECLRIGLNMKFTDRHGNLRELELIKGNHEDAYARIARREPKPGRKTLHGPEESRTYRSLSRDDLKRMHELPVTIRIPELDLICIHGGFEPHCTDPDDHWNCRVRYLDKKGNSLPATSTSDTFWADVYDGRYGFALFGHESHQRPTLYENALAVDGEGYRRMHAVVVSNVEGDERFTAWTVKYGEGAERCDLSTKPNRIHDWRASFTPKSSRRSSSSRQRTLWNGDWNKSYPSKKVVGSRPRFETEQERADRLARAEKAEAAEAAQEIVYVCADEGCYYTRDELMELIRKGKPPVTKKMTVAKAKEYLGLDDEDEDGEHPFVYVDDQGYAHEWEELLTTFSEDQIENQFIRVERDVWEDDGDEFDDDEKEGSDDIGVPVDWDEIEPGVYKPVFD